jgi:hypothetical protein
MIDGDLCDQYVNVFSHQGVPGTVPIALSTYAQAGVELKNNGVPQNQNLLALVINPDMEANALGFGANLFNPAKEISQQYMTGKMGQAIGFRWNMDQNVSRQIVGALGTAGNITSQPLISGANQTGSAILTKGWDHNIAGILKTGDLVQFAGSDGVNPISYRDTGRLRWFVLTADAASDNAGNSTLQVSPDLNPDTTSPFQTVTASPADGAVVTVYGVGYANFSKIAGISTAQAMAFHRDAFTIAIVKQELPGGMEWSEYAASPKSSLWIRLVRGYSIQDNKKYTRFDVLGGVKTIRPELACRISA